MMSDMASHKPLPNDPEAVSPLYNIDSGSQLIAMRGLPYDHSTWDILLDQLTYEEQALLVTNAAFGTSALDSIALKETKASDGRRLCLRPSPQCPSPTKAFGLPPLTWSSLNVSVTSWQRMRG